MVKIMNSNITNAELPGKDSSMKSSVGIRIRMFLGLQDPVPDPLVRGTDPDPDPPPYPSLS
jgi:hypothetical protein